MFHIVPLFLIIISLGVIVVIIARKYPELTLLDLDTIPERKEKQVKKEILTRKASKRSKDQFAKIVARTVHITQAWQQIQSSFRRYVKKLKDDVAQTKKHTPSDQSRGESQQAQSVKNETLIDDMLKKGTRSLEEEKFQEAERIFIRAIEKDQKHVRAYEGLGDVYVKQGQYGEAKETYFFARKLDPQNVALLVKLASLEEDAGSWISAIQYYEEAIMIDDANPAFFATLADLFIKAGQGASAFEAIHQAVELLPRHIPYLDTLIEISIMVQDKQRAEEGMQAIRMLDPGYQRLDLFRDRIAEMS